MNTQEQHFKKVIGLWDSVAIIIAIVIGVGIFRVPAEVAKYLSSANLIILAWLVGGIISLLGALCYAELSSSFPQTGGNYIYLRESYGPGMAFLFGWTELLVIRTGSIAAVSFVFAEYLLSFLSLNQSLVKPVAISAILILSFINIAGLRYGKGVQNVSTIFKILALIAIVVIGFLSRKGGISNFYSVQVNADKGILSLFGLALIPVLWTYGGWHENTFVAEETKNPRRILPLALIIGIFVVTSLYLAINSVYIYLIHPDQMRGATLIGSDVLQILCGVQGRKILEAIVLISSLGCINGMVITGGRVTYAMTKDNTIFRYIGRVNAKFGTPVLAMIINGVWSIVLIILGTFNKLLFFTGILVWLFFALVVSGLFILRRKFPNIERPYKIWGYPLLPVIFVIICIGLCINSLIFYTIPSLIGLGLAATGIPIFIISSKKALKIERRT